MNDVRDILDIDLTTGSSSSIGGNGKKLGQGKGGPKFKKDQPFKRPEGMHRELYALLCADGGKNFNDLAPLLPTDAAAGYKKKAKLGAKRVRSWKWTGFTNPARNDDAVLYHWRRETDENREYPFAKFNRQIPVPEYTDTEYITALDREGWSKTQTDHLFDLCRRFDLRFPVIHDRWDKDVYGQKSMEDLKERYYEIAGMLTKVRCDPSLPEPKTFVYDSESERKRKEQLDRLWKRTPEQVEEEEFLRAELKKIEARKKEREKKTQDLQKLITAADGGQSTSQAPEGISKKFLTEAKKGSSSAKKKSGKAPLNRKDTINATPEVFSAIKWPDFKTAGVSVRSQKMKLPSSVGQKKMKAIEQILNQLGIELSQIPTEEIVQEFNELRSDIVLLYELKSALSTCDVEIQSLTGQYEVLSGGQKFPIESHGYKTPDLNVSLLDTSTAAGSPSKQCLSGVIELPTMPARKRKAALEQSNVLKKLKSKELQLHQ